MCVYTHELYAENLPNSFFFFLEREIRPVSNMQSEVLNFIDLNFVSK